MKTCTCCKKTLPLTSFNKQAKSPDGYSYYCKPCSKKKISVKSKQKRYEERKTLKYTDIRVEEGKQFKTAKDFIKFKRSRMQKQEDTI